MKMLTGKKIKKIRLRRGFTQKQLAEKCDLSEPAIRNYELGNRTPSFKQLEKIAEALNVTAAELVVPELFCQLEQLGFKLAMFDDEPIIRANSDNPQLREIMIEYMGKK